jgi:hypothetical protein
MTRVSLGMAMVIATLLAGCGEAKPAAHTTQTIQPPANTLGTLTLSTPTGPTDLAAEQEALPTPEQVFARIAAEAA